MLLRKEHFSFWSDCSSFFYIHPLEMSHSNMPSTHLKIFKQAPILQPTYQKEREKLGQSPHIISFEALIHPFAHPLTSTKKLHSKIQDLQLEWRLLLSKMKFISIYMIMGFIEVTFETIPPNLKFSNTKIVFY